MAVARDQAARIVRAEPDDKPEEPARDASGFGRDSSARMSPRRQSAAPPRRRPRQPSIRRALPLPPNRRAEIRQAQEFVLMGVGLLLALAAAGYGVHYLLVGRFLRLHRRRLCARQQHHAGRAGVGPHRGDPARRQRAGARRRRDLPDRRRRLSDRGRRRAHQDRDPAGHHRPHRPPGHRAGKRGRAGPGAILSPPRPA